jgi:hypothetical protein
MQTHLLSIASTLHNFYSFVLKRYPVCFYLIRTFFFRSSMSHEENVKPAMIKYCDHDF